MGSFGRSRRLPDTALAALSGRRTFAGLNRRSVIYPTLGRTCRECFLELLRTVRVTLRLDQVRPIGPIGHIRPIRVISEKRPSIPRLLTANGGPDYLITFTLT